MGGGPAREIVFEVMPDTAPLGVRELDVCSQDMGRGCVLCPFVSSGGMWGYSRSVNPALWVAWWVIERVDPTA